METNRKTVSKQKISPPEMAFLCSLLLIDFERKWCATHYSSLPVFRIDLLAYAYSVWCLLKALFLRNNNLCASGILLKKKFLSSFTYLAEEKKKCIFHSKFDSRLCWMDYSKFPFHALDKNNGFLSSIWLSCVVPVGNWKRELCVCIYCSLFFGLDVIT